MSNIKKLKLELAKSKVKLMELEDKFRRDRVAHELFMIDGESFLRKVIVHVERKKNGCNLN